MRDLFMLAVLPFLLYAMWKRPFIALGMWPWTALFFPNGWVYGIAGSIRYNLLIAGVTIAGYVLYKHKPKVNFGVLGVLVLLFFAWTTLGTYLTIGRPDVAWVFWNRFSKVIALFVFVVLIVEKKLHLDLLLWGVALSVGFYGNLEALKFIASGGGHKIAGMYGHVLGDRNELAVAFVMTLPICMYLLGEYGKRSRYLQYGLVSTMCLLVFAVIGTQSRGGFIALLTLAGYLFIKSDRKILMSVLGIILVVVLSNFVSNDWTSRIDTIETANTDASFMGRVVVWKLSFILAMDNPFFGGGFKAIENFDIAQQLARDFFRYPWFYTGDALPQTTFARAAHSIYFQVLGDQGFVGLGLYVLCLFLAWRKAGQASRTIKRAGGAYWLSSVSTMIQLSIFAFALGGAALSFAYFDLIFTLFGLVIIIEHRLVPAELARLARAGAANGKGIGNDKGASARPGALSPATGPRERAGRLALQKR
jgi:probable O-glycosylation ligase (exosortase A-associated)